MSDTLAKTFANYYASTGKETPRLADKFLSEAAKATASEKCDVILNFLAAAVNSHQWHVLDPVLDQVIGHAIGCDPNGPQRQSSYSRHLCWTFGIQMQMPINVVKCIRLLSCELDNLKSPKPLSTLIKTEIKLHSGTV